MEALRISVIIPTYNQGQFIEETITSVLTQNYKNLQLIVIDGGSTDDTLRIIEKYSQHFDYRISEKDSGQSEAINKGLKKADGDIITWLNSDDLYEPGALQKVSEVFQAHPETDILHGKALLFGANISKDIGTNTQLQLHEYLPYMRFPQPSSFFRKKVFDEIGAVNNTLHYVMDFDLVVRALLSGFKIKSIDALLSRYRLHKDSKTNHSIRFLTEWSRLVCNIFNSFTEGAEFARQLQDVGLVQKENDFRYAPKIRLGKSELKQILLLHLHLAYHIFYQEHFKQQCFKISRFLKKEYPEFYSEKQFSKYNLRLTIVPAFIFKWRRDR